MRCVVPSIFRMRPWPANESEMYTLPAASTATETGEIKAAAEARPPSPEAPLAEPATVLMVYVWPDSMPANPAIKKLLANDLFTNVSLFKYSANKSNTVGYTFTQAKGK